MVVEFSNMLVELSDLHPLTFMNASGLSAPIIFIIDEETICDS